MKKSILLSLVLVLSMAAQAVCTGTSTKKDQYYSSANAAASDFVKGYSWQVGMAGADKVSISVTFFEEWVGMAAPQLFVFDDNGVLIGNPIPMNWEEQTKTATYEIAHGKKTDDLFVFLVQLAYAEHVAFTERIAYTIGDDCSGSSEQGEVPTCKGFSTANDAFYTQHDAAATAFDKGYNWQVSTTDKGVVIEVEFLESWDGMAAPYIFFLDSEGKLQGNDIAMQWIGTTARYVLKDKQNGDIVRFLVKIAYSGHVAFTERIEYEVGHNCEETPDAVDNLRQTTIDFTAPLEVFDLTGARVNQALDNLPQGVYIIRQGDVTKKIVRQ